MDKNALKQETRVLFARLRKAARVLFARLRRAELPDERSHEKLSEHFYKSEFACHCGCGFGLRDGDINPLLLEILEAIRNHVSEVMSVDTPIHINSGCRCNHWNWVIGGVQNSYHRKGMAVDIRQPEGLDYDAFHTICEAHLDRLNKNLGGLGYYKARRFVHIDVQTKERRRWTG